MSGQGGGAAKIAVTVPAPAQRPMSGKDVAQSAVFEYLKIFGLNQYARAFVQMGLTDLEAVAHLSEVGALEFLERLRVFPAHRLRLLRAISCLRHAAMGVEREDASQLLEDDTAIKRLNAKNEELSKERHEAADENKRLQEENSRLLGIIQQQDAKLEKGQNRVAELEELVQTQTEQVSFLAQQLRAITDGDPQRESELYRSYKDSFNDWGDGVRLDLPDAAPLASARGSDDHAQERRKPRPIVVQDLTKVSPIASPMGEAAEPEGPPLPRPVLSPHGGTASQVLAREVTLLASPILEPRSRGRELPAQPTAAHRTKFAKSLDSAQIRECLAGFDVDHVIRCLATAIQNKVILSLTKPRPHIASSDRITDCAIFLEVACRERLERSAASGSVSLSTSIDRDRQQNPLNGIALRSAPNQWDIYGFLRDVMINFRLEPEVSVVTLFYLDRFSELSGVAITPDNWQRLTITSMMLASKVWNDETFENSEFSQLCPLYTLDEINTFERTFLKCVGYNMSVKGSEYANTYFLLRTLGAKDAVDFGMEPLNDLRASRLAQRCLEKQIEFRERYPDDLRANALNWTL